jgi:hypothetical protein
MERWHLVNRHVDICQHLAVVVTATPVYVVERAAEIYASVRREPFSEKVPASDNRD